jgi:hypothetical protein
LTNHEQYELLRRLLLPALAEAARGDFTVKILPQKDQSPEFNELLVGVQSLLDTMHQQREQIVGLEAHLQDVQSGTTEILARVLDRKQSRTKSSAPQETTD